VTERPDLRELVGDDVPEEELRELQRVDALLRAVPAPPAEVPATLTSAVRATAATSPWTGRRLAAASALAAALAALSFAVGAWLWDSSGDFEARETVRMEATRSATRASATIRLGAPEENGNWTLELETAGLPDLPPGGYYVLWLAKGGDYAGTCGTFRTDGGETTVRMNASYRLADYDEWVVTAVIPNAPENAEEPWLFRAPIDRA
jgi:Anti-sigma-K factor rskA